MRRNVKSQASMEFMMSYGWAILVVISAIAALAYFGVLSPDRWFPEQCMLPSGFACLDISYTDTGIQLLIQNSAGKDYSNIEVSINGSGCEDIATGPDVLLDSQKEVYELNCGPPDGKFKAELAVKFTNMMTSLERTKQGSLQLKVAEGLFSGTTPSPPNGTETGQPTTGAVYEIPAHTLKEDVTAKVQSIDAQEKHVKKNTQAMHVVFDTTITNGDKINLYMTACHEDAQIQLREEPMGSVVGTGSCAEDVNQWVNITISGASGPGSTWDLTNDEDADYNYIEYQK